MIARDEDAAAALVEARDGLTFFAAQPASRVDGEEPQLIEVGLIEPAEIFFIATSYIEATAAEMRGQFGKSGDVPVVWRVRDGGLQQDFHFVTDNLFTS